MIALIRVMLAAAAILFGAAFVLMIPRATSLWIALPMIVVIGALSMAGAYGAWRMGRDL